MMTAGRTFVSIAPGLHFCGVHICAYNKTWSPNGIRRKLGANFTKQHVRFADAVTALEDDSTLTIRDPSLEGEERWVTIGLDAPGRLLVVVYTWRGERVRLISARRFSHQEQRQYEEGT